MLALKSFDGGDEDEKDVGEEEEKSDKEEESPFLVIGTEESKEPIEETSIEDQPSDERNKQVEFVEELDTSKEADEGLRKQIKDLKEQLERLNGEWERKMEESQQSNTATKDEEIVRLNEEWERKMEESQQSNTATKDEEIVRLNGKWEKKMEESKQSNTATKDEEIVRLNGEWEKKMEESKNVNKTLTNSLIQMQIENDEFSTNLERLQGLQDNSGSGIIDGGDVKEKKLAHAAREADQVDDRPIGILLGFELKLWEVIEGIQTDLDERGVAERHEELEKLKDEHKQDLIESNKKWNKYLEEGMEAMNDDFEKQKVTLNEEWESKLENEKTNSKEELEKLKDEHKQDLIESNKKWNKYLEEGMEAMNDDFEKQKVILKEDWESKLESEKINSKEELEKLKDEHKQDLIESNKKWNKYLEEGMEAMNDDFEKQKVTLNEEWEVKYQTLLKEHEECSQSEQNPEGEVKDEEWWKEKERQLNEEWELMLLKAMKGRDEVLAEREQNLNYQSETAQKTLRQEISLLKGIVLETEMIKISRTSPTEGEDEMKSGESKARSFTNKDELDEYLGKQMKIWIQEQEDKQSGLLDDEDGSEDDFWS